MPNAASLSVSYKFDSEQTVAILTVQFVYLIVRNPWVHDDGEVDSSSESVYQSNIRWIGVLVWVSLAILVAAIVLLAGDQLTIPSPDQAVSMLLRAFGGLLFLVFTVPVLLKLLSISRLLTAIVVFGSLGLGGRFLITNGYLFSEEYRSLIESTDGGIQEVLELLEVFSVLI